MNLKKLRYDIDFWEYFTNCIHLDYTKWAQPICQHGKPKVNKWGDHSWPRCEKETCPRLKECGFL